MAQLVDVLAEVLRSTGYEVAVDATVPGAADGPHDVALWAEREDRAVAIELWLEEAPPGKDYLTAFRHVLADTAADFGVLVNLGGTIGPFDTAGKLMAVWDRERIVTELGHAVLGETCPGVLPARDPLDPPKTAEDREPAGVDAPVADPPEEANDLLAAFSGFAAQEEADETQAPVQAAAAPTLDADAEPGFEELPGRPDGPADSEPDAKTSTPCVSAPAPEPEFEELPGRAADPTDDEDAARPEPSASPEFEELPGRTPGHVPDEPMPAPRVQRPPIESFAMILDREAPSDPAAAVPTNPLSGGYQELPGRNQAPPKADAIRADPVDGGRPDRDFEELPGRHEAAAEPADATAAVTETDEDQRLGEFEVPSAFRTADPAPSEPVPGILRLQVGHRLASTLVRDKLRDVHDQRLRLVPHIVFEYKVDVLMDGRLDAETKTGCIGVDAWMKRAAPWTQGFETSPLDEPGVEVDERKHRITQEEARQLVVRHLAEIVGRQVTQQEDSDEWSIVVKRRVRVADGDVTLRALGTFWLPIWRISGPDGAVEIDAATGEVLEEDVLVEQTDSQLL